MKKVIASVGLVALSAGGLQAVNTMALDPVQSSRWLSASLALRGFYDDNYATRYSGSENAEGRKGSFGLEVQPAIFANKEFDADTLKGGYTYGFHHQERRNVSNHYHMFDGSWVHRFSDIHTLTISEYFAISQEPQILNQDLGGGSQQRTDQNNIRNTGTVEWRGKMSDQLGFTLGYQNTYVDYRDPSLAGKLSRMEQTPSMSVRYDIRTDSTALIGYQFTDTSYSDTAVSTQINPVTLLPVNYTADFKDSRTHYYFIGLEHTFNPKLSGFVRVGAMTVSYIRQANQPTRTNPYADVAASYRYRENSMAQVGFRHSRSATDLSAVDGNGNFTMDLEISTAYVSINHALTERLTANTMFSFQYGEFRGGRYANYHERVMNASLALSYLMPELGIFRDKAWSLDASYSYDIVPSDVPTLQRGYHRNYLAFGVKYTF